MAHFRKNGFKTYIVTGGGQNFVREYAGEVYQIPPEQVVGTSAEVEFSYNKDGKPVFNEAPEDLIK